MFRARHPHVPFALVLAVGLVCSNVTSSQGVGSWSPAWSWQDQLFEHGKNPANDPCDADCPGNLEPEIAHASLIPRGPFRGCIILWKRHVGVYDEITGTVDCNSSDASTKTWIFDPASPSQLIIVNTGITDSDIFCGGHGWDPWGRLVVAGGIPAGTDETNPGQFPPETYRFFPHFLSSNLSYDTCTNPPTPWAAQQLGGAWRQIGDMAIERYYPTLMPLLKRTAFFASGIAVPGPGSFVLGGPPLVKANEGNEFWEVLSGLKTTWENHFLPDGAGPTAPHTPHYVSPDHDGFEPFTRVVSGVPATTPENLLDSYPRSVQTSASTNAILIASDVDTGSPGVNTPGGTWAIRPRYSLAQQTSWELHNGRQPDPASGYDLWHDGFYDSVVVLQEFKAGTGHKDRILLFGGSRFDNIDPDDPGLGKDWIVNEEVWEFVPASGSDPIVAGNWHLKRDRLDGLDFKRLFANAVVLPTKEILVVGGSSKDDCAGHKAGASSPVLTPTLFEPGTDETDKGTVTTQSAPPSLIERLYHSVALLLPDGRVFVAGGRRARAANCIDVTSSSTSISKYSGEIFSPPYLDFANTGISQPVLSSQQFVIDLGTSFTIDVTRHQSVQVDAMVAMRPGSVTHHFDNDQRYTELQFAVLQTSAPDPNGLVTDTIDVFVPGETVLAPAYHMLFAVIDDHSGTAGHRVPSVAQFVRFK